jgi:hypothetical protein
VESTIPTATPALICPSPADGEDGADSKDDGVHCVSAPSKHVAAMLQRCSASSSSSASLPRNGRTELVRLEETRGDNKGAKDGSAGSSKHSGGSEERRRGHNSGKDGGRSDNCTGDSKSVKVGKSSGKPKHRDADDPQRGGVGTSEVKEAHSKRESRATGQTSTSDADARATRPRSPRSARSKSPRRSHDRDRSRRSRSPRPSVDGARDAAPPTRRLQHAWGSDGAAHDPVVDAAKLVALAAAEDEQQQVCPARTADDWLLFFVVQVATGSLGCALTVLVSSLVLCCRRPQVAARGRVALERLWISPLLPTSLPR